MELDIDNLDSKMDCVIDNGIKYCMVNGVFSVGNGTSGYFANAINSLYSGSITIPC